MEAYRNAARRVVNYMAYVNLMRFEILKTNAKTICKGCYEICVQ